MQVVDLKVKEQAWDAGPVGGLLGNLEHRAGKWNRGRQVGSRAAPTAEQGRPGGRGRGGGREGGAAPR